MPDKTIHQIKKMVFVRIVVVPIEPIDHIAPRRLVLYRRRVVSGAGRVELPVGVQRNQVFFQIGRQGRVQKIFGDTDFVFYVTVNEAIEGGLQRRCS
jgi:hypothetical protein